jgi:lipopolysaccharide transport system ATP-binding protein
MAHPAVSIRGLGKQYSLGEEGRRYRTFREVLMNAAASPVRRMRRLAGRGDLPRFWALKDVSLDVHPGEVVGVIGRNGAGKSTLLKILSRITEPTEGSAVIRGRVGSLLEVGTGFHLELTGRENVYLNGAILGMSHREIRRKFDEIVAFAEVEKFLDTPVKRYSSGMHVRLAFAVAAHLDPEILIIDEVLAVGDAAFQQKCLGKMDAVAHQGRTILFVSHNMAAVESLCTRACLLESGRVAALGDVPGVLARYLTASSESAYDIDLTDPGRRPASCSPVIRRLRVTDRHGKVLRAVRLGNTIRFELDLESPERIQNARFTLAVTSLRGERIMKMASSYQYGQRITLDGPATVSCTLRNCRLLPGRYLLKLAIRSRRRLVDSIDTGLFLDVRARDLYGTGRVPRGGKNSGLILPDAVWEVKENQRGTTAVRPASR